MTRAHSLFLLLAALALGLCGCAAPEKAAPAVTQPPDKYSAYFYDTFNTVTVFTAFAPDETTFNAWYDTVRQTMLRYHRALDGYAAYEGVHSLYEVNRLAPLGPAKAEPELIELLLWMRAHEETARGRVNIALGRCLSVWHDYRTEGEALPPMETLAKAAAHSDFDAVVIDENAGTVYYQDAAILLDVGAIAKGYAVERAAEALSAAGARAYILSAGGNVRCGSAPMDGRARWSVSIQDPDATSTVQSAGEGYLDIIEMTDMAAVTSGDYQNYYMLNGVRYHHLIDPDTLMPATHVRAVTIVTEDSGLADLMSTTVFLMPYNQGRAYVDTMPGVEAYWVLQNGETRCTEGMTALLRASQTRE